MNGLLTDKLEQPKTNLFIGCLMLLVIVWGIVFWQGLTTAIDIWLISEIFNHCLFVLPGSLYLIYLKREQLDFSLFKPNYLVLILCVGCLCLYAIGLAGDVQLFMHVATFTFLPLGIWAFIGNHLAFKILFPLVFILFCIPVGEELIPTLQEITADLSVIMLNWSGIPIYRSGLYIEIPQGRFLVAEACSGISFFIASIVIGSLYAHLNMQSVKRRTSFLIISIIFPVIANAIRVFGIIVIAYLTDMEHAVGADHLIYGWIFFSLVIVCLLGIGELIREKHNPAASNNKVSNNDTLSAKSHYQAISSIVLLMLAFLLWFKAINSQHTELEQSNKLLLVAPDNIHNSRHNGIWTPQFIEPDQELQYVQLIDNTEIDVYVVWYPRGQGELISSLNRLYHEKEWTLETSSSFLSSDGQNVALSTIVSPNKKRLLSYWYVVDGQIFASNRMAKLYEIYQILMGTHIGSGLIALSQETENVTIAQDMLSFEKVTKDSIVELSQHFAIK